MKIIKALLIGFVASFMMFLLFAPLIKFDIAPFNLPPSSAFLAAFNLSKGPLPIFVHFFYGMLWSVIFSFFFHHSLGQWKDAARGIVFGCGLWLLLMLVYSPLIGWGVFGFGEAHLLASEDPLYLRAGWDYAGITLLAHMIYGATVGWLVPLWNQVDSY